MSKGADRHKEAFKEEAGELLSELESALLELEETPDDTELIGRVFRAMHTIKGSGAMFGFDDIAAFTHEVETVFDLVRNGEIRVTKKLIDLTLSARDHIRTMIDAYNGGDAVDAAQSEEIVAAFRNMLPGKSAAEKMPAAAAPDMGKTPENAAPDITYKIKFAPAPDVFMGGTNPIGILNELRTLGRCHVIAQTKAIPFLEEINPETCYTYWDIILTTNKGADAIKDAFIFVEDQCELKIEKIDEGNGLDKEEEYKKLGEILIERGDLNAGDLKKVLKSQKRLGEMLVEAGVVEPEHVEAALTEQKHIREARKERKEMESITSIRVPSEKLDKLVNLVGEMVTVQARLSQFSSARNEPALLSISEEVEHLTSELRDNTMNIRMLPIGTTFSKFRRLVRDLSNELRKEVEMTTDGAETELDKTVIEKLNDPLVHLIRNSIDHGVEMPDIREAAGKPRQGTVHLSAAHSGANVVIHIKDDGAGLDPEVIRSKAVEKGLISADAELPVKEIFALILAPGFSTAKQISSVSGRGVGMDVVKQAINALRGSIDINSRKGEGTAITLKLPLTLAIIEGLLVKLSEEFFVFPLSAVEECVELTADNASNSHGRCLANVRGEIVPYIRLRNKFDIDGNPPAIEQIVIVGHEGYKVGFVVDAVIGEHQTVIKSLGRFYRHVEGISGATILGDGTVALILDIAKLANNAELEEQASMKKGL